ncbi:MAG: VanZ family protein [Thermodesulfobacteriota bacterium]
MSEISIAAHMLVFFLGGYLVFAFTPSFSARSLTGQILLLLSGTLIAGLVLEGLQSIVPGRTASLRDIIANATGAMIFLSITNLRKRRGPFLLNAASIIIAAFLLWPLFKALGDEYTAKMQFPLLAGFETPFEASRFIRGTGRFSVTDEYAYSGENSLRVNMGTQTYSGIALEYMPRNWQGYSHLQIAVYNPQEEQVTLYIRIHDTHHANSGRMIYADRFNRIFILLPRQWTILEIPLERIENAPRKRKMDMEQITNVGFFVAREPEPLTLYIDDIRLK